MSFDRSRWTRYESEGVPVYVYPDGPHWFVPNRAGDRILRTLEEGDAAEPALEARRFLARLPDPPARPYPGRAECLKLEELRELWVHVTDRCNLTCRHCLVSSSPERETELEAGEILDLAGQAHALGCRVVALTGGEPFAHRRFGEIVDGLLALDGIRVAILTNGTLLRRFARPLAAWPRERLHLQVSIEGLGERHDGYRGRDSFAALTRELDWLRDEGIPYTLSLCVTAENLDDLPAAVDFAAEHGSANLHLMWYFSRGRGEVSGRAEPEAIFARLTETALRAERAGINLDNLEALRSQVFAPPGTRHDGSGSGWESVAVGPDGRLYPSAALVGTDGLGVPVNGDLERAWRESPVLDRLRRCSAGTLASPLRFLTGGGDPDHSFVSGGDFVGHDPYLSLHEMAALWLIAREASREPDDGPPRLRLKMGDLLRSCGAHGQVALTHNNCLLSLSRVDGHTAVKDFYTEAARSAREQVEHFLNPVAYPPEIVAHVPESARVRSFGCGSPMLDAGLCAGDTVVDLGSGTGLECFIAARLVGSEGRVVGVDMLDPMLDLSRQGACGVEERLGYRNLEFRKGLLEELPLEDDSVDVALSNCVVNLSTHKRRVFHEIHRVLRPGGRLVISDVVCETEPEAAILNDEVLRGECIAGALTQRDLFGLLTETGFVRARVLRRFPYRTVQGHPFFSMTFQAGKIAAGEPARVMYRGPFASVLTDRGTLLEVGRTHSVSRDEIRDVGDDLFEIGEDGAVSNQILEANPGCCTGVPAETASCCSPTAAAVGLPGDPPPGAGDRLPVFEPSISGRHRTGCMVCGAVLDYLQRETAAECHYCRTRTSTSAVCTEGHFVCDACHTRDALALIEEVCCSTGETDMIALMYLIRSHQAIPVHGPEHHAMVPGIILATYRNLGGPVTEEMIRQGIHRGAQVSGGACGILGVCGAAIGVGIAFGIILEANPVKPRERQIILSATQAALQRIAENEAARCCQRDSYLALVEAAEFSRAHLHLHLRADTTFTCRQHEQNPDCLGATCPLY